MIDLVRRKLNHVPRSPTLSEGMFCFNLGSDCEFSRKEGQREFFHGEMVLSRAT